MTIDFQSNELQFLSASPVNFVSLHIQHEYNESGDLCQWFLETRFSSVLRENHPSMWDLGILQASHEVPLNQTYVVDKLHSNAQQLKRWNVKELHHVWMRCGNICRLVCVYRFQSTINFLNDMFFLWLAYAGFLKSW